MKKVFVGFVVLIASLSVNAQLKNHKWQGSIEMDNQATPITLDFKKDTVNAIVTPSGDVLEQMLYTEKNGVVTFQKVYGKSDCGSDIIGKYKFVVKNNELTLSVTEDICGGRAGVLDKSVWSKAKK